MEKSSQRRAATRVELGGPSALQIVNRLPLPFDLILVMHDEMLRPRKEGHTNVPTPGRRVVHSYGSC